MLKFTIVSIWILVFPLMLNSMENLKQTKQEIKEALKRVNCRKFGAQDAQPKVVSLAHQALIAMGKKNPQKVPVRSLTNILQDGISTRSAIWVSENKRHWYDVKFTTCHEATHVAKKHAQKTDYDKIKYIDETADRAVLIENEVSDLAGKAVDLFSCSENSDTPQHEEEADTAAIDFLISIKEKDTVGRNYLDCYIVGFGHQPDLIEIQLQKNYPNAAFKAVYLKEHLGKVAGEVTSLSLRKKAEILISQCSQESSMQIALLPKLLVGLEFAGILYLSEVLQSPFLKVLGASGICFCAYKSVPHLQVLKAIYSEKIWLAERGFLDPKMRNEQMDQSNYSLIRVIIFDPLKNDFNCLRAFFTKKIADAKANLLG